jgi:hypothetical protein
MSSSLITQVSQVPTQTNLQPQLLTRLLLDLRGKGFSVDRETIMNLPESVLLCLFPNGLVLSRQSIALSDGGDNEEDEELYGVDFDPECFAYVPSFFRNASDAFYGTVTQPGLVAAQQHLINWIRKHSILPRLKGIHWRVVYFFLPDDVAVFWFFFTLPVLTLLFTGSAVAPNAASSTLRFPPLRVVGRSN